MMNYLLCSVSKILTSHKLVYGVKQYCRLLFRLFSTGSFKHSTDGSCHCDGITEATSMAGIVLLLVIVANPKAFSSTVLIIDNYIHWWIISLMKGIALPIPLIFIMMVVFLWDFMIIVLLPLALNLIQKELLLC